MGPLDQDCTVDNLLIFIFKNKLLNSYLVLLLSGHLYS